MRELVVTLGETLRSGGHRDNGFDTIRLIAASLVLISHSVPIVTGFNDQEPLHWLTGGQATLGKMSVGAFFTVSGLLIARSYDASTSLASFVQKRVLRIMPALLVACMILAFVYGPIFSSAPLQAYYMNSWRFLANAVFLPHDYRLPGVFENRPSSAVNGSLWTLKFEVACYIGAAVALAISRFRLTAVFLAWLISFPLAAYLLDGRTLEGAAFYLALISHLFRFFGAGMILYLLREHIPIRKDLAWGCLGLVFFGLFTPFFVEIAAVAGSYCLVVFAYEAPKPFKDLTAKGDISYGVYVYAWPIQQVFAPLSYGVPLGWILNSAISLPITLLAGIASWLLVEKPALALKRRPTRHAPQEVAGDR
jgi:peptidoglycan/LPS O-acetylase OafA/YrhL